MQSSFMTCREGQQNIEHLRPKNFNSDDDFLG